MKVQTVSGILDLQRGVYISALHKTDRRDCADLRCFLVTAFYEAVSHVPAMTKSLSGSITNQINRFAIAVFEEGSFIHLHENTQQLVTSQLLLVQHYRRKGDWEMCARSQINVIMYTTGCYRGRLGNVLAQHVLHKRPIDAQYEEMTSRLLPERLDAAKHSKSIVLEEVRKYLCTASPLLSGKCPYASCKEVLRILYMNAVVAASIPYDAKHEAVHMQTSEQVPFVLSRVPSKQELEDMGVFDCHVKGKQNMAAWEEFLYKGSRVSNPTPVMLIGLKYSEHEQNYIEGKIADFANSKKQSRRI